jgi:inorganic triphosphatase YgiF
MEIEAKFRVAADDLAVAAALRHLGAYTLTPTPSPEQQLNTYYDTTDRRLNAARYGLRVRRVGATAKITLKGPAEVGPDGVHRRAEHEFPGDDPHPATWPPGVARDLALALTGGAPLTATVAVATVRHILYAIRDGARVAEIAVDRGVLRAGGRERPFAEIEIELLPDGGQSDITALAEALGAHVHLQPEPRSKLQRAMDLLNEASSA